MIHENDSTFWFSSCLNLSIVMCISLELILSTVVVVAVTYYGLRFPP